MMNKYGFLVFITMVYSQVYSQPLIKEWTINIMSGGEINGKNMVIDDYENIYISGEFSRTVSPGGNSLVSQGGNDIFIAKYDTTGKCIWALTAGGKADDRVVGIGIDKNQNIYIAGTYRTTANFGPFTLSAYDSRSETFIGKLDNDGNWLWVRDANNEGSDNISAMTVDAEGNIYITGEFETPYFQYSYFPVEENDHSIFVAKMDNEGNWLWVNTCGGKGKEYGYDISIDSYQNVYITGRFTNEMQFGTIELFPDGETNNVYVAKLYSTGNWDWATYFSGTGTLSVTSLNADIDGNLYVTGTSENEVDFYGFDGIESEHYLSLHCPTELQSKNFVAKLNTNRSWEWASGEDVEFLGASMNNINNSLVLYGKYSKTTALGSHRIDGSEGPGLFAAVMDRLGSWKAVLLFDNKENPLNNIEVIRSSDGFYMLGNDNIKTVVLNRFSGIEEHIFRYDNEIPGFIPVKKRFSMVQGSGDLDLDGTARDKAGNTYFIGHFKYNISIGSSGIRPVGETDVIIIKTDAEGNLLWFREAGGKGIDFGAGIIPDGKNHLYVMGSFNETADFGGTLLRSKGDEDIFVGKMDTDGKWLWVQSIGGAGFDRGNSLDVDKAGNLVICGLFTESVSFGSQTLTGGEHGDIFVAKADSGGQWIWATYAGGPGRDNANDLVTDNENTIYITGTFTKTASFGSLTVSGNDSGNLYVAKIGRDGEWQWVTGAVATGGSYGNAVTLNDNGEPVISGSYRKSITYGKNSLAGGSNLNVFVGKLDKRGNWLWAEKSTGLGDRSSQAIATDHAGNLYLTGYYENNCIFGASKAVSSGRKDVFLTRIDSNGNWTGVTGFGSSGDDFGIGIRVNGIGECSLTGYTNRAGRYSDDWGFFSLNLKLQDASVLFPENNPLNSIIEDNLKENPVIPPAAPALAPALSDQTMEIVENAFETIDKLTETPTKSQTDPEDELEIVLEKVEKEAENDGYTIIQSERGYISSYKWGFGMDETRYKAGRKYGVLLLIGDAFGDVKPTMFMKNEFGSEIQLKLEMQMDGNIRVYYTVFSEEEDFRGAIHCYSSQYIEVAAGLVLVEK